MSWFWPWAWFWGEPDRANARHYELTTSKAGFLVLDPRTFDAPNLDVYKRRVSDEWPALVEQTNHYFEDALDPFPYEYKKAGIGSSAAGGNAAEDTDPWPRRMLSMIAGFRLPTNFFQIHLDMIHRRFPGNAAEHGIDGDLRGFVSALRYAYGKSLWRLIVTRRVYATIASVLILAGFGLSIWLAERLVAIFTSPVEQQTFTLELAAAGVCVAAGLFVIWWIMNYPRLTEDFLHAIETSCSRLATAVVGRFAHLRQISKALHDEIPKRQNYKDDPGGARKLSILALWMSMRAQHLEYFFQVEMWRVRRMEAWLRFIGYIVTVLTLALMFVALAIIAVVLLGLEPNWPWQVLATSAISGFVACYFLIYINRVVFRKKRTGRNILERNLGNVIQPGAGDARLHELSGDTYASLIDDILRLEEYIKGKGGKT
jgi:membrane protein implicated in regulation of membrane protease activity